MSVNRVFLLGRVGQLEVKNFDGQNGPRKCATLSLATSEKYKDRSGQLVENTEWHNVVSWNHAEVIEKYVTKGAPLYIEGKLRTRSWDAQDGSKRYVTEILAERIELLGQNPQQTQEPAPAPAAKPQTTPMPYPQETNDGDLPF